MAKKRTLLEGLQDEAKLNQGKSRSQIAAIIPLKMEINDALQAGYKLAEIYRLLTKNNTIGCSYNTFRRCVNQLDLKSVYKTKTEVQNNKSKVERVDPS